MSGHFEKSLPYLGASRKLIPISTLPTSPPAVGLPLERISNTEINTHQVCYMPSLLNCKLYLQIIGLSVNILSNFNIMQCVLL